MGLIYCATNLINGKKYVGLSTNFDDRILDHRWAAKSGEGFYFHKALRKYGWENFEWTILLDDLEDEELSYFERFFIKKLNTKVPSGYNLTDGGDGTFGYKHTNETKQKISLARKGRPLTESEILGRLSASEKLKGFKHSEKTISILRFLASNRSQEYREKMRMAKKGKKRASFSELWRMRISKANTGKKRTKEQCESIGNGNRGKKRSEESKRRMSKAQIRRRIKERVEENLQHIPGGFLL